MSNENGPRSMPQGARNIIRSNDSPSLWNLTLSPGWTDQESEALRLAVMKFGIGNWAKIRECQVLPYKTNAQLNLQLQRLLGQQSTAEFAGLHIDPRVIGSKNAKIQGPNIRRKNNCIVNTGSALTKDELKAKILHNKQHYEIPESEWSTIELPKIENPYLALVRKKEEMIHLKVELQKVQDKIMKLTEKESHSPSNKKASIGRATSEKATTKCKKAPKSAAEEEAIVDAVSANIPNGMMDDDLAMALALQAQEDLAEQQADHNEHETEDDEYRPKRRRVARRNNGSSKRQ
ncbi:Homeodomain-like DNA binding domain-containing transcription factor [Mucor lusitanicus]|uniref:Homeodomain-like DNA binding domain-containing transcription factor n=2 Tax=Mucor circinelloides f. lusitanicus TaxID=29924 RepID=A0A168K0I8_MUCCL|nr:Homeodomain-like DNA binding domain-containing transcription factor [Mucor lusitanicus]OAD01843.1 Homeodomain-like DNA binding domain-containing transcription factor [Mucor lusitanicus CBS 277.49]